MEPVQIIVVAGVSAYAVITDMRSHRIPNALCLFAIGCGMGFHLLTGGPQQLVYDGLIGLFSAGLILLPLYILGGMAAGDVKLIAAIGCVIGFPSSLEAALFSLIAGTLLGLTYMTLRGGAKEIRDRYWFTIVALVMTRRFALPEADSDSISQSRFPYALAIACGSAAAVALEWHS